MVETSIILYLYMYLQICQTENISSYTYVIANDTEQIMIDSSDSRGQTYLRYTGPGPRYMKYTYYIL